MRAYFDTASDGVHDNSNGQKKASCRSGHTSQGGHHRRTSCKQHSSHLQQCISIDNCNNYIVSDLYQDIGHQAENCEHQVAVHTIPGADNLKKGVGVWGLSFQFDCQGCKEKNLHRCPRSVPERARNAIAVGDARRLQQRCSPRPRRDHRRSNKAGLDRSTSCAEHFRGLDLSVVPFEHIGCKHHSKSKGEAKTCPS